LFSFKVITKSTNAAEIWLEWLKDEIRLTEEESNREKIYELFEKAVKDYICEYIKMTLLPLI
jgi:nicotinamide riboside kinase